MAGWSGSSTPSIPVSRAGTKAGIAFLTIFSILTLLAILIRCLRRQRSAVDSAGAGASAGAMGGTAGVVHIQMMPGQLGLAAACFECCAPAVQLVLQWQLVALN